MHSKLFHPLRIGLFTLLAIGCSWIEAARADRPAKIATDPKGSPCPGQWVVGEWHQWTNGHYYSVQEITGPVNSWLMARAQARELVAPDGRPVDLATLTSAAENTFVFNGINCPTYWALDPANNNQGPILGGFQFDRSMEPAGNWAWVTGEAWSFTNWWPGEPNNFNGAEHCLIFFAAGQNRSSQWNDIGFGSPSVVNYYIAESIDEPSCIATPAQMVSWWPGNGNAADLQDGNNGTLQNGATFAPGLVDRAFSLDGNDDYVSIPHNPNLNPTGPFTVTLWMKANPQQSGSQFLVIDKSHGWVDNTGWAIQSEPGGGGRIAFFFHNGSGFVGAGTITSVLDDRWHHIAGVFTGTALQIYMDGVLHDSFASSAPVMNNTRAVNIGATWGGGNFHRFFRGLIDEVGFFNRALSAQEIQDLVNAGSEGQCGPTQNEGCRIAFVSTRDGNDEIYTMNADGSDQTRLTNNAASDSDSAFSRDGSKIVFSSTRDGNGEIYVMNADGTGQTRRTNNGANDIQPAFSPDGSKIAFVSTRDGNNEIYVMNADGTSPMRLTNQLADDLAPSYSADGSKITFVSSRDGNLEVYVMNADGMAQTRLTNNPTFDLKPSFSPDGSKIIFTTNREGPFLNYLMNADGTGQTRFSTAHPMSDFEAAFSSDGSQIAFASDRDGSIEIYVINADGTGEMRLTTVDAANERLPSFGGTCPADCIASPSGMVSWWPAEGNASDAQDANSGTLQGDVTYGNGQVGQSFKLGGHGNTSGMGDRVLIGNPTNLQLQDFTIEAWIKRASPTIVTNNGRPGVEGGTFFAYGNGGYGFIIHQLTGRLGLTRVQASVVFSTATITDTNYHHVAVTKSGGTVTFYIDGVPGAPASYNPGFTFTTGAAIGARGDNDVENAFFGDVDELAIFNRALTPEEIQSIHQAGTTGRCQSVLAVAGVASRKVHGAAGPFEIDLLAGSPAVEGRSGGANGDHTIVFRFSNTLASVGSVSLTGMGAVSSSAIGADPHEYIVNLTGIADAQIISLSLGNVRDSFGNTGSAVGAPMGVLLGDTTGNGSVTSSDVGQTKSQSGQPVTTLNFRADVNAGGTINATDIGQVKANSGSVLPMSGLSEREGDATRLEPSSSE